MQTHITEMNQWLEQQMALCTTSRQRLHQEQREDEAVFEAVKSNIYGIFRSVLAAAKGDDTAVQAFFLQKIEEIPANWSTAQELARAHGDAEGAALEQLKLDTAAEIRAHFTALWENQP